MIMNLFKIDIEWTDVNNNPAKKGARFELTLTPSDDRPNLA